MNAKTKVGRAGAAAVAVTASALTLAACGTSGSSGTGGGGSPKIAAVIKGLDNESGTNWGRQGVPGGWLGRWVGF